MMAGPFSSSSNPRADDKPRDASPDPSTVTTTAPQDNKAPGTERPAAESTDSANDQGTDRPKLAGTDDSITAQVAASLKKSYLPVGSQDHMLPTRKTNAQGVQADDLRICVVMVGLPARGKSYIARKVQNYLKWLSITAQTFNVGNYRRETAAKPSADFFSKSNPEGERLRREAAERAVTEMLQWLKGPENIVAILDATNSTRARRAWIYERCEAAGVETMFVESICNDDSLIKSNILEVKTNSPDYRGGNPEAAAKDFLERIANYLKVYETIDKERESHLTFVKMINVGDQVIINRIQDYLQSRVVYFLMNLHIKPRSIWLSRHGESEYNLLGKIGGDANISNRGEAYARELPKLVSKHVGKDVPLTVWTSTLKRTIQTARFLPFEKLEWKALDELDSGVCDGLTYGDIAEKYPADFAARDEDKYNYRYLGGESYRDVVIRLEPIIMELERSENILIVTHQAVLRCIFAYFTGDSQENSPWMEVPLHTLIKLTPRAHGTAVEKFRADIPAVSTWRARHSQARHADSGEGLADMEEASAAASLTDLSMDQGKAEENAKEAKA